MRLSDSDTAGEAELGMSTMDMNGKQKQIGVSCVLLVTQSWVQVEHQ